MWGGKRVSLILPATGDEHEAIHRVIEEFEASGVIDEIIVVGHEPGLRIGAQVATTRVRRLVAPRPGQGAAIRSGLRAVDGDLVVIAEPDGRFWARDVRKLLAYAEDFDVVCGSRTLTQPLWDHAPLGLVRKWGHFAVAKLVELLFNTSSLTDVGCTFRCIRRDALIPLEPLFTVDDRRFGAEMLVLSILRRHDVIQVPVEARPRRDASPDPRGDGISFGLGLRTVALILDYRLRSWLAPGCFRADPWPAFAQPLPAVDLVTEPYDAEEEKERRAG